MHSFAARARDGTKHLCMLQHSLWQAAEGTPHGVSEQGRTVLKCSPEREKGPGSLLLIFLADVASLGLDALPQLSRRPDSAVTRAVFFSKALAEVRTTPCAYNQSLTRPCWRLPQRKLCEPLGQLEIGSDRLRGQAQCPPRCFNRVAWTSVILRGEVQHFNLLAVQLITRTCCWPCARAWTRSW